MLGEALDAVFPAVDQAVAQGGAEATEALAEGRRLTRAKYAAERTLKALRVPKADEFPLEPVKLVKKLTTPGDANIGLLRKVQADAPDSLPAVGRAMLQGFLKMTPDKALERWNDFGDQSKRILLTPQQIAQWGKLFQLADREARLTKVPGVPRAPAAPNSLLGVLSKHAALWAPEALGIAVHHPLWGAIPVTGYYLGKAGQAAIGSPVVESERGAALDRPDGEFDAFRRHGGGGETRRFSAIAWRRRAARSGSP